MSASEGIEGEPGEPGKPGEPGTDEGMGGTGGAGGAGGRGGTAAEARTVRWLALYLVIQGFAVSWGLWLSYINDRAIHADDKAEARQLVIDAADDCVNSWDGREATRDMAETVYRRNAETLLGLSPVPADPAAAARRAAYEAQVELDVVEIRAELPNPDCDLDAARRRLGN